MKLKPTSCETCGGYCLACGRPGLVYDGRPVRVFLFVAPYLMVFCLGTLLATLFFERWIPGSMRASWAKAAAANCAAAADYCEDACK